ncbi:hypothetical protein GEMRC1_007166 [Eukaryota sp. GEM-RC1]
MGNEIRDQMRLYSSKVSIPTTCSSIGLFVGKYFTQSDGESDLIDLYSLNQESTLSFSGLTTSLSSKSTVQSLNHMRVKINDMMTLIYNHLTRSKYLSKIKIVFDPSIDSHFVSGSGLIVLPLSFLKSPSLTSNQTLDLALIFLSLLTCIFETFCSTLASPDRWTSKFVASCLFNELFCEFIGEMEFVYFFSILKKFVYKLDKSPIQSSLAPPSDKYHRVEFDPLQSTAIKEFPILGRYELYCARDSLFHRFKFIVVANYLARNVGSEIIFRLFTSFLNEAIDDVTDWHQQQSKEIVPYHPVFMETKFKGSISESELDSLLRLNTNTDVPSFLNHWVYTQGMSLLHFKFWYNRRRILTELAFKQSLPFGILPFNGPLSVVIDEPEGAFEEVIAVPWDIDDGITLGSRMNFYEIKAKTRNRRPRKRKIFNDSGQLIEVTPKTPVISIVCDGKSEVPGYVYISQHSYMWASLLRTSMTSRNMYNLVCSIDGYLLRNDVNAVWTVSMVAKENVPFPAKRAAVRCLGMLTISFAHEMLLKIVNEVLLDSGGFPVQLPAPNEVDFVDYFVDLLKALNLVKFPNNSIFELCLSIITRYVDDISAADSTHFISQAIITARNHVTSEMQAILLNEALDRVLESEAILPSFNQILSVTVISTRVFLTTRGFLQLTNRFLMVLFTLAQSQEVARSHRLIAVKSLVILSHFVFSIPSSPPFNIDSPSTKQLLHPFNIVPFVVSLGVSDADMAFGKQCLGTLFLAPKVEYLPSDVDDPYPKSAQSYTRTRAPAYNDAFSVFRLVNSQVPLLKEFPATLWKLLTSPLYVLDQEIRHLLHCLWLRLYGYGTPASLKGQRFQSSSDQHVIFDCFKQGMAEQKSDDGQSH